MILWFGIGEEPRVLLVAMGSLFPVYINTVGGIRNVDPKLIELGRTYGLGSPALVWSIISPAAQQPILVGIRYALGVAWPDGARQPHNALRRLRRGSCR
jgi:sulfonate transport system permease protein